MIIVNLQGGLGNKMFQYALYKSLLNSEKEAVLDNLTFRPSWDFENIDLSQIFPNALYQTASKEIVERIAGKNNTLNKIRRQCTIPIIHINKFILERSMSYNPKISNLKGDFYLSGNWQSERYFENSKDLIRNTFSFKKFTDERNISLLEEILQQESISIHVRKGADYLKKIVVGTCMPSYYDEAIKVINEKVKNPRYYIFTDNKEWVINNITNIEYTLVDWNPTSGINNYLDMQLMANCKHNIIANSSYSWWGAWLNNNSNKIVIGPKKWFSTQSKKYDTIDLIPANWLRI